MLLPKTTDRHGSKHLCPFLTNMQVVRRANFKNAPPLREGRQVLCPHLKQRGATRRSLPAEWGHQCINWTKLQAAEFRTW